MPFCAHCRWHYDGAPRFCRQCGRRIYRNLPTPPAVAGPSWLDDGRRRGAVAAAVALLAGGALLLSGGAASSASLSGFPLDEAWVRLVYARSLATEARLAFNPGPAEANVSSFLWIGLMALLIKIVGTLGISVVFLAKAVSLAASAAGAILAGSLAKRITGSAAAAWAVALLTAVDPEIAYAGVSGLETTLFAALALGACLALLERRVGLAAALLVLATLTRFEGLVLVALAAAAMLWSALRSYRGGGLTPPANLRAAIGWLLVIVGPLAAFLAWGVVDGTSQDGILPRPLYLAVSALTGFGAVGDVWSGYLAVAAWPLRGVAAVAGLPLLLLGGAALLRSRGPAAVPVVGMFPALVAIAALAVASPPTPWSFEQRRLIDPALPYLSLLLVVGLAEGWRLILLLSTRIGHLRARLRSPLTATLVGASAVLTLLPLVGMGALWTTVPGEYALATRALNDTYFAAARYARDELPPEALIAAFEPGTLRYVSRRPVADARGLHTRLLTGRPPIEALAEVRGEYAALPRIPLFDSWPPATLIREISPSPPIPGVPSLGLYRIAPGAPLQPRDGLYAFPAESLRRLDYLDVGNEAAETAHAYTITDPRGNARVALRVTERYAVEDDGRSFAGAESFSVAAEPGRDLILARRFEAGPAVFAVSVDGQAVGEWRPRMGRTALAEDTFRIAGGAIRGPRVQVRLAILPGTASRSTTFGYWSLAER